jgi:energy-coupling factor transporter ATP-binding protein EcfA2
MMLEDAEPVVRIDEAKPDPDAPPFVPQPQNVQETGLDFGLLLDLCIKWIYYSGRPMARDLAARMALPFYIVEELLDFMKEQQYCEVVGSDSGLGQQTYRYSLSVKGTNKAEEVLRRGQYVGPAPIPFDQYLSVLGQQSVRDLSVDRGMVERALADLVLSETTVDAIGPAINSSKSVLIYGDSGNGKSTIASAIGAMLPGRVLIPYALEVYGQIVKVFDPRLHAEIQDDFPLEKREHEVPVTVARERRRDRRWAVTRRPLIIAGGELTLADLELRFNPVSKLYVAPFQVQANGGVLVIDDFGRQLVEPRELLNRWIVPMDRAWDHLTLHTGETIQVPFEVLLIFSTNLPPAELGDEAFFRRIRHKVEVPDPSRADFIEILRRVCQAKGMDYDGEIVDHMVEEYYVKAGRPFRGCHPRDIVELVEDIAAFTGRERALTRELVDVACRSYFVDLTQDRAA